MAPLAPPRFSTKTCWPSRSLRPFAAKRAIRSVPPPAGNGQIILIDRVGCQACADGSAGAATRRPSPIAVLTSKPFMIVLPWVAFVLLVFLSERRGDGVSHLCGAGLAAEIARQRLAFSQNLGDGLVNEIRCGARLGVLVLAGEPPEQHL